MITEPKTAVCGFVFLAKCFALAFNVFMDQLKTSEFFVTMGNCLKCLCFFFIPVAAIFTFRADMLVIKPTIFMGF